MADSNYLEPCWRFSAGESRCVPLRQHAYSVLFRSVSRRWSAARLQIPVTGQELSMLSVLISDNPSWSDGGQPIQANAAYFSRLRHYAFVVLHPFKFFVGRHDSSTAQVRRTQEHSPVRQHCAPALRTTRRTR